MTTENNANKRNYILFSGNGTLNIGGTITGGGITSNSDGGEVSTGTVNYTNTNTNTSQMVGNYTYYNLNLSTGNFLANGTVSVNGNFKTDGLFNSNGNAINFNGTTECGNGSVEANDEYISYAPTAQYIIKGNYRGLDFSDGIAKGTHYTCGDIAVLGRARFRNTSGTEIHTDYNIDFKNTITARTDAFIYASNNTTVTYSGTQSIIGGEYYNLAFANGNEKIPYGDILVNGTMTWNSGRFLLYNNNNGSTYNFTLGPTATISSTGTYASGHCFVFENGAEEGFVTVKGDVSRLNSGTIPVGNTNNNNYRPVAITGTTTGESSFSVRPTNGGSGTGSPTDLQCFWTTVSENISNVTLTFTHIGADYPSGAILKPYYNTGSDWEKYSETGYSGNQNGGTITFTNCSPTGEYQWSACEDIKTYYSFTTGNWNDATSWTFDPAGIDRVNPKNIPTSGPEAGSRVVIKNPDKITVTSNRISLTSLTINEGGELLLGETTGHTFGNFKGQGTLKIASNEFPSSTYNGFVRKGGGTVEYCNTSDFTMPDQKTYNHLVININGTATLGSNFTTNGDFTIKKGTFQIGNNNYGRTIKVVGNMTVEHDGIFTTNNSTDVSSGGSTNSYKIDDNNSHDKTHYGHKLELQGDFTNNGNVYFTLQETANYTTSNNRVTNVFFTNDKEDQNVVINGSTKFYSIRVQKGTDKTHILNIDASSIGLFSLLGPRTDWHYSYHPHTTSQHFLALAIDGGTVRLGQNITIDALMDGANNGFKIDETSCLWIDGATVAVGDCFALYVHGDLKVTSNGHLNVTGPKEGIVYRTTANITLEDEGEILSNMLRTSMTNGTHIGSLTINGGTLRLTGNHNTGNNKDAFPTFGLTYPTGGFNMTGGKLIIERGSFSNNANRRGYALAIGVNPDNCTITGGTLILECKNWDNANYNCHITSTVPFWNVEIEAASTANVVSIKNFTKYVDGCESVAAHPLVVLNNLTISNRGTLDANEQNVYIGGNFTINNTATYTPGNNTTFFNGSSIQNFTNGGTVTNGLNNLTLTENARLTLQSNATVRGILTLESNSVLNELQNTLTVTGNIVNNSGVQYNSGSSTGCILLSGTSNQTIGGDGHGSFNNLHINKTNGTVTLTANTAITGNLRLISNTNLNIGTHNLNLCDADAAIYSDNTTGTNFSSSKMIQTSGNSSDGGITRLYSTTDDYLFPFGYGSNYLPATIAVDVEPTTYGSITSRPVNGKHYVFGNTIDALQCYWHNTSSGFEGVTSVNHHYRYEQALAGTGENTYVPAYYKNGLWYPNNTDGLVNFSGNYFYWESCATIDGDFTCGIPTAFSQAPRRLYSSKSGPWNDLNTWSLTEIGDDSNHPDVLPGANTIVVIGDANHHHTITTPTSAFSGSLSIAEDSYLDLGTIQGHNFGLLAEDGDIEGKGTIIISSTNYFPRGDFGDFLSEGGGTIEYKTISTDITPPTNITGYNNLKLTATDNHYVRMPNANVEIFGNLTSNSSTNYNRFNTGTTQCTVTVDGDLDVETGTLAFYSSAVQNLVVKGDINISSGANFNVKQTTNLTNQFTIYGDMNVDGNLNFVNGSQEVATTFTGTADASIKGSGEIKLYTLTCDKGTDATPVLSIEKDITASYQNGVFLDLRNGTFRANGNVNIDITRNADLEIGSTACLSTQLGTFNICNINNDTPKLLLHGKLEVLGGNMNIGDGSHGSDIEYQSALASIDVQGGTLTVSGQIRRSYNVTTGDLHYSQSGGNVVILGLQRDREQTQKRALIEVCNNGSFNMSGGKITLVDGALNNASYADVLLTPATSSATGGIIAFGGSSSTSSNTFYMNASAELGNIEVGTDNQEQTLKLVTNHVDINGSLTIEVGSVFDANGFNVEIAGNISCKTSDGYLTGDNEQLTTLNGTATQKIKGDGNNINFANLTIDNPTTTQLNDVNVNCNGLLTISRGALDDAGNNINALTSVVNNSRHISSVAGGGLVIKGSGTHELRSSSGESGIYGNLAIKSRTEMKTPIMVTGLITLNSDLYANDYSVKMMQSSTFAGNSSGMIILNGAIGDAGVRKYFANGFSGEFVFRIGISEHYTPAVYNFASAVTSSDGYINVKPMNKRHSNIETTPVNYLEYYWMVESEGLSDYTVTHEYYYTDDLMTITDPSYDLLAQRFDGVWENMPTGSVLTDENRILITGLTRVAGEYTAGSPIYQKLPTYYSVSSTGNWTDPSTWVYEISPNDWRVAQDAPNGNPIVIRSGHKVTMDVSTPQCAYSVEIQEGGTLDIGSTIGHNLGIVKGGGTLKVDEIDGGGGVYSFMIPAGKYDDFFSTTTSTIQFEGDHAAVLPAKPGNYEKPLQNIFLTGTGTKTITSSVFYVKGKVTIDNHSKLDNSANNRDFYLGGDFIDWNTTTSGFISGTSKIIFAGTETQKIDIIKEVSFYNVQINNAQGVDVTNEGSADKNVIITNNLTLTNGVFKTNAAALIYLSSTNQNVVSGGSSSSFVDGPLRKKISTSGYFDFPVGNGDRYGNVKLTNVNNGSSAAADWTAQYFNANPSAVDDDATFDRTALGSISDNEYWIVSRPDNSCSAKVALRWDEQSCTMFGTITQIQQGLKIVEYDGSSEWIVRDASASGTASLGMLTSDNAITQDNYTFTFGYAGVIATITTTTPQQICNDGIQTASINVSLSGTAPFTLSYRINGGTPFTQNVLESYYTISRNSSQLGNTVGTYVVELLSISDATTEGQISPATGSIEVMAAYTPTFTDGGGVNVAGTGETRTYEVVSHTGSTYHWEWSGDGPALANPNANPISVTYGNTPATYTLVVTETAASECVLSNSLTITISNTPQPSFIAAANICEGDQITYSTAEIEQHSYQWYVDNDELDYGTSHSVEIDWGNYEIGPHKIKVVEINDSGIDNDSEASITIYAKPASPTINDIAAICAGTSTTVELSTTQSNVIYRLYKEGTDNSLNTIYGNGSSLSFTTPTINESVNLYAVASNLGCNVRIPESGFKSLEVYEIPEATFDWPTIYKGVPTVIAYTNNTSIDFSSFSINYSAGGTNVPRTNFDDSDITVTATGDVAGIITITNEHNCSANFEFNKLIADGYVWSGSSSTEWDDEDNWYSGAVPNNEHDAIIRTAEKQPVISSADAQSKSVKIESGVLTITGSKTLEVYGDWQNEVGNEGFVGNSSTVAFQNDAEISGNTTFGSISNASGNTLNISSGHITVNGNVENGGTLSGDEGTTIEMAGSADATMSLGIYNLANLTIYKTEDSKVTSAADLNVSGTFAINAGVLTMGTNKVVNLGVDATATSGGETAFVDGTMTKLGSSAITFPIGNNGRRAMVGIEPSGANESTLFTAKYTYTPKNEVETPAEPEAKVDGLKRVSSMDRWEITGESSSYLTLYWDNGTISEIGDPATLVVAHWNTLANQWEMFEADAVDGTSSISGGIRTRGLVSSYSPYAFGATDDGINPLPVELVGFTGRQDGNSIVLEWTTLSEKDNDYFEIERSVDGENFVTLGRVAGAGNSTAKIDYNFVDNEPVQGRAYYRLSQVDYDGTRSFADRLVSVVYTAGSDISLTIVPNPTRGQFNVRITGATDGIAKLLTQSGRLMQVVEIYSSDESIDISDFPNGIYILQYQTGENVVHERIIKL